MTEGACFAGHCSLPPPPPKLRYHIQITFHGTFKLVMHVMCQKNFVLLHLLLIILKTVITAVSVLRYEIYKTAIYLMHEYTILKARVSLRFHEILVFLRIAVHE